MRQKGLTASELLVGISITLIGILGISVVLQNTLKTSEEIKQFHWLHQIRSEAIRSLKTPEAWKNTVTHLDNSDIECLKRKFEDPSTTINCPSSGGLLRILNGAANETVLDLRLNRGFNKRGLACEGFGTNPDCQFSYDLSWTPKCRDDKCLNPDFLIQGHLKISKASQEKLILNPEFYSFKVYATNPETQQAICQTTGLGDSIGDKCRIKPKLIQCDKPDQYLVGFQRDGTPKCATRNLPKCNGSGFIYGVTEKGEVLCDPRTCI